MSIIVHNSTKNVVAKIINVNASNGLLSLAYAARMHSDRKSIAIIVIEKTLVVFLIIKNVSYFLKFVKVGGEGEMGYDRKIESVNIKNQNDN